ncbi:MAG TPA: CbiX/SirB N-terminal domain-containing protein [Burkholderiaceae bacterium]|nr:CbiX/SirB N-terminal domain-containing protein [Burkholderiaceae bacterium]
MNGRDAIILFAHGAKDARWALPLQQLQRALALARPQLLVQIAFLELQEPSLAQSLATVAAAGCRRIDVAPIFWSQGGHMARELPQMVQEFAAREPGVIIRVLPVLSELPGMEQFLAQVILAQTQRSA